MIPNVLSIAGSDPSGGAGIQADLKAFAAMGAYGMAALTALTAQNTRGVTGVEIVPPPFVAAQIAAVLEDVRTDAVKIGMIGRADIAEAVAAALAGWRGPLVLDPVMVAKGGARLLAPDAVEALRGLLLPRASLVTPNLGEAADLIGSEAITDRVGMERAAEALLALGPDAVLVKGGHLEGPTSADLLLDAEGPLWLEAKRVETRNTHGTGCTLAAAIAARLARGEPLRDAVRHAKHYVTGALAASDRLEVGSGHGPVHHFHALWR